MKILVSFSIEINLLVEVSLHGYKVLVQTLKVAAQAEILLHAQSIAKDLHIFLNFKVF